MISFIITFISAYHISLFVVRLKKRLNCVCNIAILCGFYFFLDCFVTLFPFLQSLDGRAIRVDEAGKGGRSRGGFSSGQRGSRFSGSRGRGGRGYSRGENRLTVV